MKIALLRGGGMSKRPKWQMLACLYKQPPQTSPFPNPHWWSGAFRYNNPPPPPPPAPLPPPPPSPRPPALHFTPLRFPHVPLMRIGYVPPAAFLLCSWSLVFISMTNFNSPMEEEGQIHQHTLSKGSHLTEHMTGPDFLTSAHVSPLSPL